jgi:hypothetical protein
MLALVKFVDLPVARLLDDEESKELPPLAFVPSITITAG